MICWCQVIDIVFVLKSIKLIILAQKSINNGSRLKYLINKLVEMASFIDQSAGDLTY